MESDCALELKLPKSSLTFGRGDWSGRLDLNERPPFAQVLVAMRGSTGYQECIRNLLVLGSAL